MKCPGSVRQSAGIEERTSVYAAEGSAAHTVAADCLKDGLDACQYLEAPIAGVKVGVEVIPIDVDMVDAVQVYLDACREMIEPGDEWDVEQRLDLSEIHPDCFGTADFVNYKPETRQLIVADYKHGRGVPVEVLDNEQLLFYALGAMHRLSNRGIATVTLMVVQPRCPHPDGPVRSVTIEAVELFEWAAELKDAAERTQDPDAPLVAGGWCRFCPAAPTCPALMEKVIAEAKADFTEEGDLVLSDPKTFSGEELAKRLGHVDMIEGWCRKVREFAHHEAEAGRTPPGFKLVATRATRKWKDEERTIGFLTKYGLDKEDIYVEPKVKSPAQVEKVIGKKNAGDIAELIESVSSGTVLAPLDDKRPPVRAAAQEDFTA